MKLQRFLILALLAPGLLCLAQDPAQNRAQDRAQNRAQNRAQEKDPTGKPAHADALAPSSPDAPPPAMAFGTESQTYIIGPSDSVAVSVWKEGTLSGTLLVRPDGMISMPLLGDIQASGLTPPQLADQIETKLKKYVQDPRVSVVLTQIKSKVIYMMGEFGKKGPIDMTPGMTLLQAIASAGGLSEFANAKKIYILRDEGGKHLKIPVHYKAALKGDSSLNLLLKPGDTLVAP